MNMYYYPIDYNLIHNIKNYINFLLSDLLFLFLILTILSIISIILSYGYHKKNRRFLSGIFMGFFIAFVQIIITVFFIEKILLSHQENQWEKTKILINDIVISELQDDLTEIVYVMDFSDGMRVHNYIEGRLENNQKLTKAEAIYAGKRLLNSLKLENFADHYRHKKGEDIIDYQAGIIEGFASEMETNLWDLDRMIDFSQVKLSVNIYTKLIECRKEYHNLIKHSKGYSRFLSASEITGELYDYNLKFEMKHRKEFFDSIIKTINLLIDIISIENLDD